jgi:hypothetical protein
MKHEYEEPHEDAVQDVRLYWQLQAAAERRELDEMLAKAKTREDVLRREEAEKRARQAEIAATFARKDG